MAYSVVTTGLCIGSALLLSNSVVPPIILNLLILLLAGAAAYLAVLLFLAFYEGGAEIIARLYFGVRKRIRPSRSTADDSKEIEQALASFYQGFRVFRENPRALTKPFLFHIAAYILGLLVYVFVFYALGITAPSPVFYIFVYFVATAFQDAIASFSVGSLDIILATIFIVYGINPGASGLAAAVVRSASFWFPFFISFVCVQIMGAKKLVSIKPDDMQKLGEGKLTDKPVILLKQKTTKQTAIEPCILSKLHPLA